jgi:putative peptidoglycan lipid II flippase
VRSSQVGILIWAIMGVGMALLVVMIIRRWVKRGLSRRSPPRDPNRDRTVRGGSRAASSRSVLSSTAVMAAGTVVSRISGFARGGAARGGARHPAPRGRVQHREHDPEHALHPARGGVFNAVLVPQLVRAMKYDADGGTAYTSRVITLAGLFLAGVTAILVLAARC